MLCDTNRLIRGSQEGPTLAHVSIQSLKMITTYRSFETFPGTCDYVMKWCLFWCLRHGQQGQEKGGALADPVHIWRHGHAVSRDFHGMWGGGGGTECSREKETPNPFSADSVLGAHLPVGQECVGVDHRVWYLTGPSWAPSRQTAGGWQHRMPSTLGRRGTSAKNVLFLPPLTAGFQKTVGSS